MAEGRKTGGRQAGTPNKATKEVKDFLASVFEEVFRDSGFRQRLVREITEFTLDPKLLTVLLAYYAGKPSQQVDHTHKGRIALEQIIAGTVEESADEDPD